MRMMRRVWAGGMIALSVFSVNVQAQQLENHAGFHKMYEKITFDVNADVDQMCSLDFMAGTAEIEKIDVNQLARYFYGNENVQPRILFEDSRDDLGNDATMLYWEDGNNNVLSYTEANTTYVTDFMHHVNAAFEIPASPEDNSVYSTEKEIEGFSRKEAYETISDFLKQCKIPAPTEYVCYALPHEQMQENECVLTQTGEDDLSLHKQDWNEEDDSYYFFFRGEYCGLPCYHPYLNAYHKDQMEYWPLKIVVNRRGIQSLDLERIFLYRNQQKKIPLLSFEEIADLIAAEFSQLSGDETFGVDTVKLLAMEKQESASSYTMRPVWMIHFIIKSGEETREFQKFYDAETGAAIMNEIC